MFQLLTSAAEAVGFRTFIEHSFGGQIFHARGGLSGILVELTNYAGPKYPFLRCKFKFSSQLEGGAHLLALRTDSRLDSRLHELCGLKLEQLVVRPEKIFMDFQNPATLSQPSGGISRR